MDTQAQKMRLKHLKIWESTRDQLSRVVQKNVNPKNLLLEKKYGSKNICSKQSWVHKILCLQFLNTTDFVSKNVLGSKTFCVKKCQSKKILGKK